MELCCFSSCDFQDLGECPFKQSGTSHHICHFFLYFCRKVRHRRHSNHLQFPGCFFLLFLLGGCTNMLQSALYLTQICAARDISSPGLQVQLLIKNLNRWSETIRKAPPILSGCGKSLQDCKLCVYFTFGI